jgi:hypothetical protein
MTIELNTSSNTSESTKYCIICRDVIEDIEKAYQTSINLSLVCKKCQQVFSHSDLELISGIFIAFGGYFGSLKHKNRTIDEILDNAVIKKVFSELIQQGGKKAKIEEINIKVLHQMLLHGFTPQEYVSKLNAIVLND